jgi:hypothetical protein
VKPFEQGNEWMKLWSENQKSLFEAWVEGKPPPFAFRGEAPAAAPDDSRAISDLMRRRWSSGPRSPRTRGRRAAASTPRR